VIIWSLDIDLFIEEQATVDVYFLTFSCIQFSGVNMPCASISNLSEAKMKN